MEERPLRSKSVVPPRVGILTFRIGFYKLSSGMAKSLAIVGALILRITKHAVYWVDACKREE